MPAVRVFGAPASFPVRRTRVGWSTAWPTSDGGSSRISNGSGRRPQNERLIIARDIRNRISPKNKMAAVPAGVAAAWRRRRYQCERPVD